MLVDIAKIQAMFSSLGRENTGLAAMVVHQNKLVWEHYSGFANIEHQIPVASKTVFPIASITKQFTAMIIMMLVEECLITYEDSVTSWYPALKWARGINIRHLLHQTSGLPDPYEHYKVKEINCYGLCNNDVITYLHTLEIGDFPPGEKFSYSNSNYILLAQITEKVMKSPFADILQKMIFAPLGMKDTLLYDARDVVPNRAYGYCFKDGQYCPVDIQWLAYGDGGIMSTAQDFLLWDKALTELKLVSRESYQQAFTQGRDSKGGETPYGFGWAIRQIGANKVFWHSGGDPGFGSMYIRIPHHQLSVLMLSNLDNSWQQFADIRKQLFEFLG